ncbi:hypothetical protein [Butyrivibrio sp. JL13D10]|uniref:hypothetical protein n=1 Tax=Butyrivibrio sp. JL13D10 TaxID=3236815 RepID=UPI0038B5AB14
MKKTKNGNIKRIIFTALLLFSIWGTFTYSAEVFGNTKIISQEVVIVDKYETGNGGKSGNSYYMKGINENGEYKIPGTEYDIGDTVTVYQNPDSANAKGSDAQWYTSSEYAKGASIAGLIFYFVLVIISAVLLYHNEKKLQLRDRMRTENTVQELTGVYRRG